ncbi:MAG: flagellar basal-body MS-ring/collar protein FliF [Oceanococcaceae bacterium]
MDTAQNPPAEAPSLGATLARYARHPGARQLGSLVGIAAAIAIGLTAWFWSQSGAGVPLFTGLSPSDEMAVVEALQSRNIKYSRGAGAGSILVPADAVHELRLALAAEGLPRGSGVGFELIRDVGGLGSSPFMESARYQHVLETELARTIANLHPVQAARVHLATPRRSAFVRPEQTASAAVMLQLHPGRSLDAGQVAAIVHLVSSSVPQLAADRVSVVDQRGSLLSRPAGQDLQGLDAEQIAYQARVEQRYVERILQLLQPVTGANRVSAQVAVAMDFSRAEQTREVYEPDSRTLRSEQLSEEQRGEGTGVGGVPGALANRPPTAADDAAAKAGGSSSLQSTRNYEINRTIEQTWRNPGRVQRINAAVIVDNLPGGDDAAAAPLSAEQLAEVDALVREAIGFDQGRGDSVSVRNLRFQDVTLDAPEALPLWKHPMLIDLGRQLIGLAVLLFVALRLFRPALRAVLTPQPALPAAAAAPGARRPLAVAGGDASEETQWESDEPQGPKKLSKHAQFEEKLGAAREVVTRDPARVANVVRGWIADE